MTAVIDSCDWWYLGWTCPVSLYHGFRRRNLLPHGWAIRYPTRKNDPYDNARTKGADEFCSSRSSLCCEVSNRRSDGVTWLGGRNRQVILQPGHQVNFIDEHLRSQQVAADRISDRTEAHLLGPLRRRVLWAWSLYRKLCSTCRLVD